MWNILHNTGPGPCPGPGSGPSQCEYTIIPGDLWDTHYVHFADIKIAVAESQKL